MQTLLDQITSFWLIAMWEVSVVTDRVLSFVTTRRHLLFFYSYLQGITDEPIETILRRHGNDMVYELEMFLQECRQDSINFPATVHPYFIQGPTSYAPFTYVHCRINWFLQAYVAVGFSQL